MNCDEFRDAAWAFWAAYEDTVDVESRIRVLSDILAAEIFCNIQPTGHIPVIQSFLKATLSTLVAAGSPKEGDTIN